MEWDYSWIDENGNPTVTPTPNNWGDVFAHSGESGLHVAVYQAGSYYGDSSLQGRHVLNEERYDVVYADDMAKAIQDALGDVETAINAI